VADESASTDRLARALEGVASRRPSFPRTRANSLVLLSMIGTGAIIVVGEASRGELPRPRRLLALGVVYVGLATLATVAPPVAVPAALVVLAGTALARGQDAAEGITRGFTSPDPLGTPERAYALTGAAIADAAAAAQAGVNRAAGTENTAPNVSGIFRSTGPVGPPLIVRGSLIGTPYAGTHSLGNWQSDNALDIRVPNGTPVLAVADGTIVKRAGSYSGGSSRFDGYQLTLEGAGNAWFYTHLMAANVPQGARVRKGQVIGLAGSANGVPHLHIGQRSGNPLDTLGYR
jgi:murein DD-endopeptidase MepM/ murein hydrolase activator NlpD